MVFISELRLVFRNHSFVQELTEELPLHYIIRPADAYVIIYSASPILCRLEVSTESNLSLWLLILNVIIEWSSCIHILNTVPQQEEDPDDQDAGNLSSVQDEPDAANLQLIGTYGHIHIAAVL